MKTLALFIAAFGLVAASSLNAAASRIEVIFDHPEKFTDIKDSAIPTDKGQDAILHEIRSYLEGKAAHYVPEGCRLTITFSNIDLAGEFQAQNGLEWQNIRVVTDGASPAYKFTWKVTNAAGALVKEGKEDFRDLDFGARIILDRSDPLRFEKAYFDQWMSDRLSGLDKLVAAN